MSENSYLEYRNCIDVWIEIYVMALQHRVSRLSGVGSQTVGQLQPTLRQQWEGPTRASVLGQKGKQPTQ